MQRLRLLINARPGATAWLVALALAMRVLVPGGYMPVATGGGVMLGLCPGAVATPSASHSATSGMHHGGGDRHREAPAAPSMPCAFAAAGLAALDVPAPTLDTVSLSFAVPAIVRVVVARAVMPPVRWRPPLRAPPRA